MSGRGVPRVPVDALPVPPAVAHPAVRELLSLREALTACGLGLGLADTADPAARPAGPAEEAAAAAMSQGRRREFLAGRLAARRALHAVGLECGDIPRAGRAPLFPAGRTASITHSDGLAVAVARGPGSRGPVGCDLELRPLPGDGARLVLREDEERWLRDAGPVEHLDDRLTVLFSAKEAAWKALNAPAARTPPGGPGPAAPAGPGGTLRGLRTESLGDRVRVWSPTAPERALDVRVAPVGRGVFSWVLGEAAGPSGERPRAAGTAAARAARA